MPDDRLADETVEHILSNSPTSFTDTIEISIRKDKSVLFRLLSFLPEDVVIENHRTIIRNENVVELINDLCEKTGYFPDKRKKTKS